MKKITIPLYDVDVHLFLDREDFKKRTLGLEIDEFHSGECSTCTTIDKDGNSLNKYIYIFIDYKLFGAGILSHECLHASYRVMKLVGIRATPSNHEAQAYIIEFLAKEMTNYFYEYKKRQERKTKRKCK